jgi:two-component SAPR family response regulator
LQAGQDLLVKQHKSLLGGAEKCKTERDRLREAAEAMDKHLVHAPLSEQGFKLWQRLGQAVQDSGAALGDKT